MIAICAVHGIGDTGDSSVMPCWSRPFLSFTGPF